MKRRWLPRMIFKASNIIIVIVMSLSVVPGCSVSSYKNIVSQKIDTIESKYPKTINVYEINEPFVFGDWEYTVLGFEESNEYNGYKTDNKFIIVTVKIENKGKEPAALSNDYFVLIDAENRIYESDSFRDISFQNKSYFSLADKINPGISKEGRVSFEAPQDINTFALAIRDNMFDFGGADYRYVMLKASDIK